jgi:hypothetical protein
VPITFLILRTGGNASAGSDYTDFNGGTISIPNGSATGDLNIAVTDDLLFESNETVSALILNQSDPAIKVTAPRATGSITDNDNLPGSVDATLSVSTHGSETGPTNIVYTVTISKLNFTGGNVSFNISHLGGTTTTGTDFTAYGTSTISIGNGSNTGTFSVNVTNDSLFESTETAIAQISVLLTLL